ncbi:hypothetical protein Mapa_000196 [Marchantia paleacea]|nr:hypothetical protein Mapa_000196 [Marchantia paleacea]
MSFRVIMNTWPTNPILQVRYQRQAERHEGLEQNWHVHNLRPSVTVLVRLFSVQAWIFQCAGGSGRGHTLRRQHRGD